jgi:hypothetical protein
VDALGLDEAVASVTQVELGWTWELHQQLNVYANRLAKMTLEKPAVRLLANPQRAFCLNQWHLSTLAERRVLYNLAHVNYVNPVQWETVLKLEARGLALRDPALRLASVGLQRTIRTAVDKADVARLTTAETLSPWGLMRLPLLVLVGLGALFLFLTQRDLFDTTAGTAMGLVVALPAVMRVVSLLVADNSVAATPRDVQVA